MLQVTVPKMLNFKLFLFIYFLFFACTVKTAMEIEKPINQS